MERVEGSSVASRDLHVPSMPAVVPSGQTSGERAAASGQRSPTTPQPLRQGDRFLERRYEPVAVVIESDSLMGSRAGRVLLRMIVLLATLVVPAASAKAQPAAYRHYRTMQTAHFRVVVARGLEREGSAAAAVAESAYAKLSASLAAPRG